MDTKLRSLQARAENAQAKYEEGAARLLKGDGSRLYADDEHDAEMNKLRGERDAILGTVQEEARLEGGAAREERARIENSDPADVLSLEELEQANAKRLFAIDSAETLGEGDLRKRLESVLAGGDRGSIFAYLAAGRRRVGMIHERRRGEIKSAGIPGGGIATSTTLDGVLARMEETLGGDGRRAAVEESRRRASDAATVDGLAWSLRRGARSGAEVYANQAYGDVAERIGVSR